MCIPCITSKETKKKKQEKLSILPAAPSNTGCLTNAILLLLFCYLFAHRWYHSSKCIILQSFHIFDLLRYCCITPKQYDKILKTCYTKQYFVACNWSFKSSFYLLQNTQPLIPSWPHPIKFLVISLANQAGIDSTSYAGPTWCDCMIWRYI